MYRMNDERLTKKVAGKNKKGSARRGIIWKKIKQHTRDSKQWRKDETHRIKSVSTWRQLKFIQLT